MVDVSVIIPVYNAENWVNNCMESIAKQTILNTDTKLEIIVNNDGSNDNTEKLLLYWKNYYEKQRINFYITHSQVTKGVGAAKNVAVRESHGQYLCFQDIDDVMMPERITLQLEESQKNHNALVGSRIVRNPKNSTPRLVKWANSLDQSLLKLQIYTSNGPTLLMPTWFCHRSVYDRVGGFDESGHGTPEDLIFFYIHLDKGGDLVRIDKELVIYTYHKNATTFSVTREKIWALQLERIERHIALWNKFTIWNAGKAGRKFVRKLSSESQTKVATFCDVDKNKIGQTIELYCPIKKGNIVKVPVVHFSDAKPPLIICVKFDLTNGEFENNLKSMNLKEGKDYIFFN